jgi:hypothetical protein
MTWGFLWLMLALKIPICGLLYIVWWAVHQTDEAENTPDGEGGTKRPIHPRDPRPVHPRGRLPRLPRRGGHSAPAPLPPPRVRSVVARARELPPR